MKIINPEAAFTSVADMLAATLPAYTRVTLLDGDTPLWDGRANSAGTVPNPLQDGTPVPFSVLEANATTGYEIKSGILQVDSIAAGGASYLATETATVVGGTITWGGVTFGVAMQVVIDTVDGGGAVTAVSPAAGRAGHGDYLLTPDLTAAVATTGGSGTGLTLNLSVAEDNISVDANGSLVLAPARATDNSAVCVVRLPGMSDDGDWYFPSSVEAYYTMGTITQVTYDAANPHASTFVGVRVDQTAGTPDPDTDWECALHHAHTVAGGVWRGGCQSGAALSEAVDGNDPVSATEKRSLRIQMPQRQILGYPLLTGHVTDRDVAGAPRLGGHFFADTGSPWDFTTVADRADVYLVVYAGPTANDQISVTMTHVSGMGQGWSTNP